MNFEPTAKNAADIAALIKAMEATPVGETITYGQLSDAIGRPIQRCRYLVLSAIKRMNRDNGALFANVHRVGYKRLSPQDSYLIGSTRRQHIRRTATQTAKRVTNAMRFSNDMPPEAALKANRELSVLGLIAHISTDRAATTAEKAESPMPVAKIMSEMLKQMA